MSLPNIFAATPSLPQLPQRPNAPGKIHPFEIFTRIGGLTADVSILVEYDTSFPRPSEC